MSNQLYKQETYVWTGKNKFGTKVKGEMQAISANFVKTKLAANGILITKVGRKQKDIFDLVKKKVKTGDIVVFARNLSTLLNAKVTLFQALDVISKGSTSPGVCEMVSKIKHDVESGLSLTEALRRQPKYFDSLFCGLVRSGELSGTLDVMLTKIAEHLEKAQSIRRKVKRACVYPIFVLTTSLGAAGFMLIYIIPQFETLFESKGQQLPLFTQMILSLSKIVRSYWLIVLAVIAVAIYAFIYAKKHNQKFSYQVDAFILKLPIFGPMMQKVIIARLMRTLAITLGAGISITDSLTLGEGVIENKVYARSIIRIRDEVTSGKSLSEIMELTNLYPVMAVKMVEIGEKTGELKNILNKVSEYFEEEIDLLVGNLSAITEPLILIVLGGIIGSVVIAMYLPIFSLGNAM